MFWDGVGLREFQCDYITDSIQDRIVMEDWGHIRQTAWHLSCAQRLEHGHLSFRRHVSALKCTRLGPTPHLASPSLAVCAWLVAGTRGSGSAVVGGLRSSPLFPSRSNLEACPVFGS